MASTIEDYKKAIITAHQNKDYEAAQLFADRLKQLQAAQPEPTALQSAGGMGEVAATIGSGAIAEPVSGIAGIAKALPQYSGVLPFLADKAFGDMSPGQVVEQVQDFFTYQPRTETGKQYLQTPGEALQPVGEAIEGAETYLGDVVYEATGSPALAAGAATIPTAALELAGAGLGRRAQRGARAATESAEQAVDAARDLQRGTPTEATIKSGTEIIQEGTPEQVAEFAKVDPEFFRAADELGISAEPLAAFASQNPQFRDISGALRSVPGSVLDVQAREFIEQTAKSADDLIQQYGGTLDKAELGRRFKDDSLRTVDELADEADQLYSSIREQLPPQTRVEPLNTIDFLQSKADEFGGVDELPKELKQVYMSLSKEGGPTLGLLDQIRKDFGQATRKGTGRFKDSESGLAKAMYSRLSSDVDSVAEANNLGEVTSAAKEIVKQRKQLEDNLTSLYGKDLSKSLGDIVGSSIKGLEKGRVDRFTETMKMIPKEKRGEVALSFMNDVFKGAGANQQALNPTQFVKWYDSVSRSPRAKGALYSALPKDSRKAIDNLYKVSKGISQSQAQTVKTGAINSMFDKDTGFVRKLVGSGLSQAAARVGGGMTGSLAVDAMGEFLNQSTSGAKAASNLLASPQFQNMIRNAVKDGVVDGGEITKRVADAERKLAKTKSYEKWVNSLTAQDRAAVAGGLIPYLFSQDTETDNRKQE